MAAVDSGCSNATGVGQTAVLSENLPQSCALVVRNARTGFVLLMMCFWEERKRSSVACIV